MGLSYDDLEKRLWAWAASSGIAVCNQRLGDEMPATFDGRSVAVNRDYSPEERVYYLAHALGSIAAWSLDREGCVALFDKLRAAKERRRENPGRLEVAIARYRAFEERTHEYTVWLLDQLGLAGAVGPYTNFMRADLEALTRCHQTGTAPGWPRFFADWNRDVAAGCRQVELFNAKIIPPFRPVPIPKQEVLQAQENQPES